METFPRRKSEPELPQTCGFGKTQACPWNKSTTTCTGRSSAPFQITAKPATQTTETEKGVSNFKRKHIQSSFFLFFGFQLSYFLSFFSTQQEKKRKKKKYHLWSFPAFFLKLRVVCSRDHLDIGWQELSRKASHYRGRMLSHKSLWILVELVRVRIPSGYGRKAQNGRISLHHQFVLCDLIRLWAGMCQQGALSLSLSLSLFSPNVFLFIHTWMPSPLASSGSASASNAATLTIPLSFSATRTYSGANCWQCPHHGA